MENIDHRPCLVIEPIENVGIRQDIRKKEEQVNKKQKGARISVHVFPGLRTLGRSRNSGVLVNLLTSDTTLRWA